MKTIKAYILIALITFGHVANFEKCEGCQNSTQEGIVYFFVSLGWPMYISVKLWSLVKPEQQHSNCN